MTVNPTMIVVVVVLFWASAKGYRGRMGFARSSSRVCTKPDEPMKPSGGGGVFSFLKSEGPDFFIDDEPKKPASTVKAAVTAPKPVVKTVNKAPAPLSVGRQAPSKIKASVVPAKAVTTAKPATVISSASKPPPVVNKPALVSKPLTTVKMPEAKPLIAAKPSNPGTSSSSSNASIKPKPASGGSSDRLLNVEALPEFLQSTLAPAVDAVNDFVELPANIERKTQETIKSIVAIPSNIERKKQEVLDSVDRTVNTVKYVASIPGKIAESTVNTVNLVKGTPRSSKSELPVPREKVTYVANAELVKSKQQQSKPSAAISLENVKESIYRVGDVIEGTANLIQATGKGAVSAFQAAQRLPSDLERFSKSTTAKVEETKASIDSAVSGAEEVAASVTAFGESIVKLPQTVESKVVETRKSVEGLKAKIAYVQDRLQGKPLPPPPPKPPSDLQRAIETAAAVGRAGVWGVKKGVEFATWLTEKRDPSMTSSAKPSPSGVAKGLKTGTVVVANPSSSSSSTNPATVTVAASLPKVEATVEPKAEIKAETRTEATVAQSPKVVDAEEVAAPAPKAMAPQLVVAASATGDSKDPPKRSYSPFKKESGKKES